MSDFQSFGDFDLDDVFCNDGDPDNEQMARMLHQIQIDLLTLAEMETLTPFDDLTEEEKLVAYSITEYAISRLKGLDTSNFGLANDFHDAVIFFSGEAPLEKLPGDQQSTARSIAALVIEWMSQEGTLR